MSSDPEITEDQLLNAALQKVAGIQSVPEQDLEPEFDDLDEPVEEPKWDPDPEAGIRRLEAVLFLAKKPLTSRKLSQLAGLEDGTQARTMVKELNQRYDQAGRSFHVKRVAGGYQMLTRPKFSKWIRRLEHVPKPTRLSNPMLETLAVVAYRQPIIKAEIEAIRGVSCGEILRQLLEKGLVKIAGRSPELGRPFLYATSKEFLTLFGFNSLDDLPRAEQLVGTGLPQWANPTTQPETTSADLTLPPDDENADEESPSTREEE